LRQYQRDQRAKWSEEDYEKERNRARKSRAENPHVTFWTTSRYHAKLAGAYSDLTKEDAADIYYTPDVCAYCGKERNDPEGERTKRAFHVDHIIPMTQGGANSRWNLTKVCNPCNTSKGDRSLYDFYARCDAFTPDRLESVISEMVRLSGRTRPEIDELLAQSRAFEIAHQRERERMDAMMRIFLA
jgi:5-methylcytosine-specific restriction endonuclease McrA